MIVYKNTSIETYSSPLHSYSSEYIHMVFTVILLFTVMAMRVVLVPMRNKLGLNESKVTVFLDIEPFVIFFKNFI